MKYCINYYKDFRYLNEVDEIIFTPKDMNDNFVKYIEENFKQEQRIIVNLTTANLASMTPIIDKLKSVHPYYAIIIDYNNGSYEYVKDKYNFFFGKYCKTFDEVYTFIDMGVTDVYIVETLGFSLADMGIYAKDHGVFVRVLPNVAQSTLGSTSRLPQENKFFIRPEDTDIYEDYVTVFELFGDVSKLSVTYEIYKAKEWHGPLNYIIQGFKDELFNLDNKAPFGKYRLNCKQRCYKCQMCSVQRDLNKFLTDNKLKVVEKKDAD